MTHDETVAARADVRRQLNDELEMRDFKLREEKKAYEKKKNELHQAHVLRVADINTHYRERRLDLIEQLDRLSSTPSVDTEGLDENSGHSEEPPTTRQ